MKKSHELLELRAAAVSAMRKITDTAESENRDLTADEAKAFDTRKAEIVDLDKQIERAQALADIERRAPAVVSRVGDGEYATRAREFSITKAIRAACGEAVDVGFEREISAEVQRRSGRAFSGIPIPDEAFLVERRTLLTSGAAADLVPNQHLAAQFIDRLRNALVIGRLGARVLDGLVGAPVDIPRQTGSSTAQWLAEDASLTETDAAFDDLNLSPKTVGALTSYSRRTLINAVPSIEQLVRDDLAQVLAGAIDEKAIAGDGAANTPVGILNTAGIGVVSFGTPNGGVPTWIGVLDHIAELEIDNAIGRAFLTNPKAVKKMRSTVKVTTTDSVMIQEAPDALAGYPLASSNNVPSNLVEGTSGATLSALIFGNFSDLIVGYWSGTDLLVNPYAETAYAKGRVQVRAMRDVDVGVRHAESFAASKDMITV